MKYLLLAMLLLLVRFCFRKRSNDNSFRINVGFRTKFVIKTKRITSVIINNITQLFSMYGMVYFVIINIPYSMQMENRFHKNTP